MNRRTFLKSGTVAALSVAFPFIPARASAALGLKAVSRTLEVNGRAATVFGLTGPDGKPGLVLDQAAGFHVELQNTLTEPTLIHWHGLTPPWPQDGVPDLPAPLLAPGERRAYAFDLASSGTNWMHAHTLQEQALLAAPLIIRSAEDIAADEQEVALMLHDFSFRTPQEILASLTGKGSAAMNMKGMDMGSGGMGSGNMDMGNMKIDGMKMDGSSMADQMKMPMDLNDIEYDAYLINDRTLDDPDTVMVDKGGRVRLRVINGSTSTAYLLDLGGLEGELIAVDGQPVAPRKVTRLPLSMAQRADIRLAIPKEGGSFPILALREGTPDRSGLILSTRGATVSRLAVKGEKAGPVLDLDFEAGLRAARPLADKAADRAIRLDLVGNMMTYQWGFETSQPLVARPGERLEITLANTTMMAHPMHLHGHHFQVVAIDGKRFSGAVRDTVLLPPMRQVTIAVDAGNPGKWAFHCHHLYHMATGMMTYLAYEGY
nr:multicopper oxidase family protein [uncultured Gellertiella sp.]